MNIVLTGLKHCGKSTLARGLADRLGGEAFDTDDLVIAIDSRESGQYRSVRDIFQAEGDEGFAALERRACGDVLQRIDDGADYLIVALGGRTAMRETLRPLIKRMGTVVYLKADPSILFERVMAGGLPPFLDPADPRGSFLGICRQREPVYEQLADITVDTRGLRPEQVRQSLLERLGLSAG